MKEVKKFLGSSTGLALIYLAIVALVTILLAGCSDVI